MILAVLAGHHGGAQAQAPLTFPLEPRWTASLPAGLVFAPAYDDRNAYAPLRNGHLVAVALENGESIWNVEVTATAAPVAGDGLVFVGSQSVLEARAPEDGQVRWRLPLDSRLATLHFDSGWLFLGTDGGELICARGADGQLLWRRSLGSPVRAAPVADGDRVFVTLEDAQVLALALRTGDPVWTAELPAPGQAMLVSDDRLFLGSLDNRLYSISITDGRIRWAWRTGGDILGAPAVDHDRIYFVSLDNMLRALDRGNGSLKWHRPLPMRPSAGPLLVDTLLIVPGVGAQLRAYAGPTGAPAGEFPTGPPPDEAAQLAAPPHLARRNGFLILATRDGHLTALAPRPPAAPAAPAISGPPSSPPEDEAEEKEEEEEP